MYDLIKEAKDQGSIPWTSAASFFVQVQRSYTSNPTMSKEAALGILKLAHIQKVAQTPEQQKEMADQAMTDPNVMAALEFQQLAAQNADMRNRVLQLQAENEAASQQIVLQDQAAQQAQAQTQQLSDQLQMSEQGRQQVTMQALQAQDSAMQKDVDHQMHRQQLMDAADQMSLQLKQLAATSPAQQQQNQAMVEEQAAAEQTAASQPLSQKSKKQTDEAQQAAQQAQVQGQQAAQAQMEDQAKVEQAAAAGAMPKMSYDRSSILQQLKSARSNRLEKTAQIGRYLIGSGIGAAAGAGTAGTRQALLRGSGKQEMMAREKSLADQAQVALIKARQDPTTLNTVKALGAQFKFRTARFERKHPGLAVSMGAAAGIPLGLGGARATKGIGKVVSRSKDGGTGKESLIQSLVGGDLPPASDPKVQATLAELDKVLPGLK